MAQIAKPRRIGQLPRTADRRTVVAVGAMLVAVALVVSLGDPGRVAWVRTFFVIFGALLIQALPFVMIGATAAARGVRAGRDARATRPVAAAAAAASLVSILFGAGFGLVAGAVATAAGTAALQARGIELQLDGRDYVLLVAGSAAAAALWAAIGVGLGSLVRNQVPTLIGICAWLLFVEGLLAVDIAGGLGDFGRFLPGSAAEAISGQDPGTLLAPAVGLVLLACYAAAAALVGSLALSRRDVG